MSIALVRNPKARHTATDDRESFFYVLVWISLRHLNHALSQKELWYLLDAFDSVGYYGDQLIGGELKEARLLRHMKNEDLGLKFQNSNLAPLTLLIRELAVAFGMRYGVKVKGEEDPQIKAKIGDGEWMLSKLRQVHDELKAISSTEDDWVDKKPDKRELHLPPYLSHLVRTRFHWALPSTRDTLTHSLAVSAGAAKEEEEEARCHSQDPERPAKRIKTSNT